jgi:hypothetical protein
MRRRFSELSGACAAASLCADSVPVLFTPEPLRVATLAELDALVGEHVMREKPEVYWEDSHGYFQFHSEVEARQALRDPYYQRFLPPLDWSKTLIREVRVYPRYSSDSAANWRLADAAIEAFGPMLMWRANGRWHVAFGTFPDAAARHPMTAMCFGALSARGVPVQADHDALDAEIPRLKTAPSAREAEDSLPTIER